MTTQPSLTHPWLALFAAAALAGCGDVARAFAGSPAAAFGGFNASEAAAISAALAGARGYVASELVARRCSTR